MRHQWLVAFMLIIAISASSLTTPAWSAPTGQQPGLTMKAQAAYDGYFKYGEWLPIWVELENVGPDLETEIQIHVPGSWGATTFAAPTSLPTGSRKRVPVYVLPNNFSHTLEAELVASGKILISQKVPVKSQPNISYLVGLISPKRDTLSLISSIRLPGLERPKVLIDLSPAGLPERAEGLRSFDCLIVNDTDTSSLTPQQKEVLENWVRRGGRLVIGGGAGASHTVAGLPEDLLPFLPRGQAEVDTLPTLANFAGAEPIRVPGPFVVATGDQTRGYTLAVQAGLPLVREQNVGNGFVDFVALDLASSPFDAWTGTTAFWERLLSPGAAYPDWLPPDMSPRQTKSGQMTYALSNLPVLDLPSIRGLGLLLVVYVLLVGPANYLLLRWRKRLHWAWITIPLITVAFSAGAFGLGYALRGSDLILNKIAIIELQSDGTAAVTSYLGLFSPSRQSYEIQVAGEGLLSPVNPDYNPWGPGGVEAGGEVVFVQGDPSRVRGLAVNQWSMQTFMTEGRWESFGAIESDLQLQEEALVGTLRNQTSLTLADTALVLGNHFVRLGDLEPYASKPVQMKLSEANGGAFGQPLSFRLLEDQLMQPGPTGPPREAELRRVLLESVFDQGYMAPWSSLQMSGSGPQQLALIGWLNQAPPQVAIDGREPTHQTTALLYAPIAYNLPAEGEIVLPPGLLRGALVEMPLEGGRCGPQSTSLWLGRGDAVFEFQVPEELLEAKINRLKLLIRTDGGGWWQAPAMAMYTWEAEEWIRIEEPVMGTNIISNANDMVSQDGQVRIRLSAESNLGGCLYLELGVEGQR